MKPADRQKKKPKRPIDRLKKKLIKRNALLEIKETIDIPKKGNQHYVNVLKKTLLQFASIIFELYNNFLTINK